MQGLGVKNPAIKFFFFEKGKALYLATENFNKILYFWYLN